MRRYPSSIRCGPWLLPLLGCLIASIAVAEPSHVTFNDAGIAIVDGKPFFPLGVFTYALNSDVLAELHELQCNAVVHGFESSQLDLLHEHGLMAICPTSPPWIEAAAKHPALLGWYLSDEPENRGTTPEQERERYLAMKAADPHHPVALCHTAFDALTQYKEACDVTMTDIYPITAKRDRNVMGVSIMMDEARRIHGAGWPQWTYIQTFGGPEADGGVWAPPLPHEVRFMTYLALVHRATGIFYFSYWPQQPRTWQSIAGLNAEIQRLVPRLVALGREHPLKADHPSVEIRLRTSADSTDDPAKSPASGLVIAVNTSPKFAYATFQLPWIVEGLSAPFEHRDVALNADRRISARLPPYGVRVYTWGPEPDVQLARESN